MSRTRLWLLMAAFAVAVAAYAGLLALVPQMRPGFLRDSSMPLALMVHFTGGALAMAVGPFQFRTGPRARRSAAHRLLGRVYVIAILASGIAGFAMAFVSQGGLVAHMGFGLLAVSWLTTTIQAYLTIRRGNTLEHQRWIVRSFALTYAAVTLRLYLPLSLAAGVPFEVAYPIIAWACWVPNLAVAEWFFVPRRRSVVATLGA